MLLAQKFGMYYTDRDNQQKLPYIIHRTSVGCYERTLALLIEKYAGALPTWMAPTQVKIMTITEKGDEWAKEVEQELFSRGIRTELDLRNEKIGFKIRQAQQEKVPYMLVIGGQEAENKMVAVRNRKEGDLGTMTLADAVAKIEEEIRTKAH